MLNPVFWLVPVASLIALFFAWFFFKQMMKNSEGNDTMKEIALDVRNGAMAYLRSQYRVVALVFLVLVILLAILAFLKVQNPFVPIAFLTGGFFSGLCGYLGMKTATYASGRTAQGASQSLNQGLKIAFRSGAVMGLVVVGFGLLDIAMWFWFLNEVVFTPENMTNGLEFAGLTFVHPGISEKEKMVEITVTMLTFGMGASTQALFARVGGGIFTKAADVGADLVGKVEAGIPEDDPRNPATIADNVGDNVGDVAGMGADLYESYCGSILATAALGAAIPALTGAEQMQVVMAPMIVAAVGILLSILGIFMVRTKESATQKNLLTSLLLGTGGSSFLILLALAALVYLEWITWGIFGSVVVGLLAGVIIGQGTEYFTSDEYKPTKGIAKQGLQGPATIIIEGIAVGMFSTWVPVVTITIGIVGAFGFAGGFTNFAMGVYGIGFAAVGMLSTLGITLATDAFGPIADNAGGNAEMSELPPEVRERTDALDMLGNTTAATGKGFAIGSAALTAMALLAAYIEEVRLWLGKLAKASADGVQQVNDYIFYLAENPEPTVAKGQKAIEISEAGIRDFSAAYDLSLFNPMLLSGLFIGAMMAFVFSSLTMKAVGRAAGKMVDEVRRQFKEMPGIMERKTKPDYARCVEISTKGAQREMVFPSLLAIIVPVIVGVVLGVPGVVGLLAGGLTAGFTLAVMLNNSGGAWDNAKKFIEKGNYGGKNSEAHHAGVVGDTVGDPFKDTSGPSLNILIKLMTMVSVVMAGLTVAFSLF
ncbi:sodium-translocating pyrophosphatase [Marinilabilia rubra]|uniref:Putative K(+)-stimulated pyrophosphate-energized sodium pump n=1 Tax=Marinilabilia rubra TaxID=2162893 RepID=A0A2U2B8D9_9BACT|nr:sodium-translocating pyrophosphatase [Marinilabilia rubra]PWD99325.1 sodium-translocating pyrophosphatase [Marinilabilia rubra]